MAHGELTGIRAPGMPDRTAVWVAKDGTGRRHLLVEVPPDTQPLIHRTTRGLETATHLLRIGDRPPATYIDLMCLEPAHHRTFAAVATDIANSISSLPSDPRAAVVRALERWRSFWIIDPTGLGREEALGLFGELWFMTRWMGQTTKTVLDRWQGPAGGRHDFQWESASVEVKCSASSAHGLVHTITSFDQLDNPETGVLYLFSLHVADDALAANTLPILVERVFSETACDSEARRRFEEQLANVGYNPAHADAYNRKLRIISEDLYRVDGSFPRLTAASFPMGLPPGIHAVSYRLSMAPCVDWRIASSPQDPEATFLKAYGP